MAEKEDDISGLPRGSVQSSFAVFAEWLKDNRKSIEHRLDQQDQKLNEIHQETKRTNGRVTDLEKDADLARALATGKEKWTDEREAAHEKRTERWEKRATIAITLLGSGLVGTVGHLAGFW